MQGVLLVVNCGQEVTSFLFPVREYYIITVMQDVTTTIETRMINQNMIIY